MSHRIAVTYEVSEGTSEENLAKFIQWLKVIPWTRVVVDVLILAAMLVVSSRLLVR